MVAFAILARIFGFEHLSETSAPNHLKLVLVPSSNPLTSISLWMPLALFVISFFQRLSPFYTLCRFLLRHLTNTVTKAFSSCSSSARASMSSANCTLVIILSAMLTFPSCFSRALHNSFEKTNIEESG